MCTSNLSTRFTFLGGVVLVAVAMLAYIGYRSVDKLLSLTELDVVASTIRHHMELDMMHDAANGDVLIAIAALQNKNAEDIEKAFTAFKKHSSTIEKDFGALHKLQFSPEVTSTLKAIEPQFRAYIKDAENLLMAIKHDAAAGSQTHQALAKDFAHSFEVLEKKMSDGSDTVDAWSKAIKAEGEATAEEAKMEILIILVIAIGLSAFLPVYMRATLFRSLNRLVDTANALSQEKYDVDVPFVGIPNEIGKLANSLESLRVKAAEAFRLKKMVDDMPLNVLTADVKNDFRINYLNNASKNTLRMLQQYLPMDVDKIQGQSIDIFHKNPERIRQILIDPKNLPHRARVKFGPETIDQEVSALYDTKGEYVGALLTWTVVTQNEQLAQDFENSVGAVSAQIASSANQMQQRASTLQAAIEELSVSAMEISKRAHESLRIVQDATAKGNDAGTHTSQLSVAAEKVTSVVTLINSIAEKTNLLALNATIESARAGEAGKGFAVVANEVKTLASQTANAITDITTQVNEMRVSAGSTADAIKHMCDTIVSINKIASDIASTIEEQQASTAEIARNVSGKSGDKFATDGSMIGMADQLASVSGHLKKQCDGFLDKVRKM